MWLLKEKTMTIYPRLLALQAKSKEKYRAQFELAYKLGIPDYRLSLIIGGRKPLTEELLQQIEKVLNCSRADLLPPNHPLLKK